MGYAMIYFGAANAIGSFAFGQLVKYTGRIASLILAASINYLTIYVMLTWQVNANEFYVLNMIAMLWGISDSIWQTQVNSLYGVLFEQNQEAAFSNFRLWESLGFFVSYFYSNRICVKTKLYLLLAYLSVGMLGYFLIELNEKNLISFSKRSFFYKYKLYFILFILFLISMFLFNF